MEHLKSGFFKGVGIGAGLLATSIFAAATAMNIFSAGEVVSASKINQNFAISAPEGAIMAFYLANCPDGWAPADGTNGTPDLRGVFIRGRDDIGTGAAGNDPAGVRALGNLQLDAFQGHWHSGPSMMGRYIGGGAFNAPAGVDIQTVTANAGDPIPDASTITPRTATETRPKNIALTYCMRKNS